MFLPRKSGIYKITNSVTGKVWIGQSIDILERYYNHMTQFKAGTNSSHMQRSYDKYGIGSFIFEVVELCCREILDERENFYIEKEKSWDRRFGYNIQRVAKGRGEITEETRKKISEALTGRILSETHKKTLSDKLKGRIFSDETKKRISESTKGKKKTYTQSSYENMRKSRMHPLSEETKNKISESIKGRPSKKKGNPLSEDTKSKMSKSRSGKLWYNDGKIERKFYPNLEPQGFKPGRISNQK